MRFRLNLAAALLAAAVIWAGPAAAQDADPLLQRPRQLEKEGRRQEALNAYHEIFRQHAGRDPEAAARALYEGGKYALERFPTNEVEKRQGQDTAAQWWKQVVLEYPGTQAARELGGLRDDGQFMKLAMEISRRNSSDWKYQLLDGLVKLCGNNPAYSYGLALVLLAVLVKIILLPLTKKQYASMREMQRMQPLVKALQAKYKGPELNQKMMELYREHGVNPLAGCLPMMLQLPFLILVFGAIREYEFAFLKGKFLWIGSAASYGSPPFMGGPLLGRNLAEPDVPLLTMYALTNYITMKLTPATDPQQQQTQNMMAVMTTVIFFYMFLVNRWSSAFVLYWFALNLLSIWQQYEYVYKPHKERLATNGAGAPTAQANGAGAAEAEAEARPVAKPRPPARVKPRKKRK